MLRLYKVLPIIIMIVFLVACSDSSGPASPAPDTSLGVSAETDGSTNNLTMSKDALGKEFFLNGAVAYQKRYGKGNSEITNPTSKSMRTRIVIFEEQDGRLAMLDVSGGTQPGDEIKPTILLTTFPIVASDETTITFDFNDGMKNVIISFDWYVSDIGGMQINEDMALSIEDSFLEKVENNDAAITAVQVISARTGAAILPMKATYYLSPYKPNPNYKPALSPGFRYLGYLETNPLVEEGFGVPYTYIARWDITKPIKFYLSQDIPIKYRDAVREGVLYWNKAFGHDVIQVDMAPGDVKAPNFDYNLLQWHTDHYQGAYADAQVEPRTGEILRAQVFFSSGLADVMKYYVYQQLDRSLNEGNEEATVDLVANLTTSEFESSRLCDMKISDLQEGIYKYRDTMSSLSDERLDELTRDFIRALTAHEMGHIMGLRHNFAGSMVNEWKGLEQEDIVRQYIKEGTFSADIKMPLSSVMEYASTEDYLIVGSMMKTAGSPALDYDYYVIQWGYFGSDERPVYEGHPFCTDSQIGMSQDCAVNDSGGHIVERNSYLSTSGLEGIPLQLAERYLIAKANYNEMFRVPVENVNIPASMLISKINNSVFKLWSIFVNPYLRSIKLKYSDFTDVDWPEYEEESLAWLDFEIAFAGGIEGALRIINPEYFEKTVSGFGERFGKIIASDMFRKAPLPEGGTVNFTEEEIAYILSRAEVIFPEVEQQLALGLSLQMQTSQIERLDSAEKLESIIARWAEYIITTGSGLDFHFSYENRQAAVNLLKDTGPLPDWMGAYVPPIAEKLRSMLEEGFGLPLKEIDLEKYPRRERDALRAELDLYYLLANGLRVADPVPPVPVNPKSVSDKIPADILINQVWFLTGK